MAGGNSQLERVSFSRAGRESRERFRARTRTKRTVPPTRAAATAKDGRRTPRGLMGPSPER